MTLTNPLRRANPFGDKVDAGVLNAIGPETFTYRELVEMIAKTLQLKWLIVGVPPAIGYWVCRATGALVQDVVITREEIRGLMENRLYVRSLPLGRTKLSEWVSRHHDSLGRQYTSEMRRRVDRISEYRSN